MTEIKKRTCTVCKRLQLLSQYPTHRNTNIKVTCKSCTFRSAYNKRLGIAAPLSGVWTREDQFNKDIESWRLLDYTLSEVSPLEHRANHPKHTVVLSDARFDLERQGCEGIASEIIIACYDCQNYWRTPLTPSSLIPREADSLIDKMYPVETAS